MSPNYNKSLPSGPSIAMASYNQNIVHSATTLALPAVFLSAVVVIKLLEKRQLFNLYLCS